MNLNWYILFDLSTDYTLSRLFLMMLHQRFFFCFIILYLLFDLFTFWNLWCQFPLFFLKRYFILLVLLLCLYTRSLLSLFGCFQSRWWRWSIFFTVKRLPLGLFITLFTWRFVPLLLFHVILIFLLLFRTAAI